MKKPESTVNSQQSTVKPGAEPEIKTVKPEDIYAEATATKEPAASHQSTVISQQSTGKSGEENSAPQGNSTTQQLNNPTPSYNDTLDDEELAKIGRAPDVDDPKTREQDRQELAAKMENAKFEASVFIKVFNPLQAEGYEALYKSKLIEYENRIAGRRIARDIHVNLKEIENPTPEEKRQIEALSPEEKKQYYAFAEYTSLVKSLPYSPSEEEMLIEGLAGMMQENGWKIPAWMTFSMAFIKVNVVRMSPLRNKLD